MITVFLVWDQMITPFQLGPDEISTSDLELIENDNESIKNQPFQSDMVNTEQSASESLAPSK